MPSSPLDPFVVVVLSASKSFTIVHAHPSHFITTSELILEDLFLQTLTIFRTCSNPKTLPFTGAQIYICMSETPRFQSILRIFLFAWHPQSFSHVILKAPTFSPNRDWSCVRLHGNQTFLGNIWMDVLHPQTLWSWKPNQPMCSTRRSWSAHGSNNWSARGPKVSAGISPQKVETFPMGCVIDFEKWRWLEPRPGKALTNAWTCGKHWPVLP